MGTLPKTFIGIDVSKGDLVTAFPLAPEQWEAEKFDNNEDEIAALVQKAKGLPGPRVVLEATGNYSMKVVFALCENQAPVSVLNPKQSKGFIQGVLLPTTKTDAKDACAVRLSSRRSFGSVRTSEQAQAVAQVRRPVLHPLRAWLQHQKKGQHFQERRPQLEGLALHGRPLGKALQPALQATL